MTLAEIIAFVENKIEGEELTLEDIEDYEVKMILPSGGEEEGIVTAIDCDINTKQHLIEIYVDIE